MTGAAPRKSFGSDNHAGTHPAVMRAIVEANAGDAVAYGAAGFIELLSQMPMSIGPMQHRLGPDGSIDGDRLAPHVVLTFTFAPAMASARWSRTLASSQRPSSVAFTLPVSKLSAPMRRFVRSRSTVARASL